MHCCLIADIEDQNCRPGHLRGQRFGSTAIHIGNGHSGAGSRQRAAGGFANPAGAAGNQGGTPIQSKRRAKGSFHVIGGTRFHQHIKPFGTID
jgi:hypothetical protein